MQRKGLWILALAVLAGAPAPALRAESHEEEAPAPQQLFFVWTDHVPAANGAAYAEKGIDTGWRFYQAITGEDLPVFIVAGTATDAANFHANEARVNEILGEEGIKLIQEAMSIARRVERTAEVVRPDLSLGD